MHYLKVNYTVWGIRSLWKKCVEKSTPSHKKEFELTDHL